MKKIESVKQAFELEGLDPENIKIEGIPERHINAVIAVAKLMVVHDAVNPEFDVDYKNSDQYKYENWFELGSPSGVGFRFCAYGFDWSLSSVGARLVSESSEASRYIGNHPEFAELYKQFMVYKRTVKK